MRNPRTISNMFSATMLRKQEFPNKSGSPNSSNLLTLGALSDGGVARTITKAGTGTLTLGTAATGLVDGTNFNLTSGTLNSNNVTALGGLSLVNVADNTTLGIGASQTFGALTNTGTVLNNGIVNIGANTLTLGSTNNLNSSFTGTINGGILGILTKAGSGTMTLGGSVSLGRLNVNSTGIINIGAGNIILNNNNTGGATIQSTTGGTINATGGGTLTVVQANAGNGGDVGTANGTTLTINAKITGSNAVDFFYVANGTGVVVLAGANDYSGRTIVQTGVLSVSNFGNTGSTTSNLGQDAVSLGFANFSSATLRYTGLGETSNRVIDLLNTTSAATIEQAGVSGNLLLTSDFLANGAGAKTLTLQSVAGGGTGEISGKLVNGGANATALAKTGTGTWTLSNIANTFSGGITVAINGGSLVSTTAGGLGTGIVKLNNDNTGTSGTVKLNLSGGTLGSPNIITNTFNFASQNLLAAAGAASIQNVSGFNRITGTLQITNTGGTGTNIVSDTGNLELAGPVNVGTVPTGVRVFDLGGAGNGSISGVISNGAVTATLAVQKDGAGTWTLSNFANTYTGSTTVNAGTLRVDGVITSAVTVANLATLGGGTTATPGATGAVTVNPGGTINPGAAAAIGTLNTGVTSISGTYICDLDATSSDLVASTGALTLTNATLEFNQLAMPTAQSYTIATYPGIIAPAFTTITGLPTGYLLDYTIGGQIKLMKIAGYGNWALSKGLDNSNNGVLQDPDNDSISNLAEYVLNGNPLASSQSILPTQDSSGANLVFTFTRRTESKDDTTQTFQYGSNLVGWTNLPIPAASAVDPVTITPGTPTELVVITIPKGANTTLFGRLQIVK